MLWEASRSGARRRFQSTNTERDSSASGGSAARGGRKPKLRKQSPLQKLDSRDAACVKIHAGLLWQATSARWMRVGTKDSKGTLMTAVADSIVVKRLVRNLRYKLTYIKVFESFLQPEPHPAVVRLLHTLVSAQQTAVVPLSGYLQSLGVATQGLPLNQRLLDHASGRNDVRSRLRFVHYGLSKAVSWYKMQLMDRQMTADLELKQLLFELGEREAAGLWHTEAVMAMLRIPLEPEPKDQRDLRRLKPQQLQEWHPRLEENVGRPAWKGRQSAMLPSTSRSGHSD